MKTTSNEPVKLILSKLISINPNEKEVKELKEALDRSSDEEVHSVLDELWVNYEPDSNSYQAEENRIKLLLDQKLKMQHSQKKFYHFSKLKYASAAAVLFILVSISALVYVTTNDKTESEKIIAITTTAGETKNIDLPDGSKVSLNASSKISYSSDFKTANRTVNLEGEAFFDVMKLGNKFIVKSNNHEVEVLGTSFNVKSYLSDNLLEIVLLTGKVKISRSTGKSGLVYLEPNEKYTFDFQSNQAILTQTNVDQETSWLRGELVFRNETLQQVLIGIERFYGVNITTSKLENFQDETFNGRFDQRDIEKVLEILAIHYPITYSINNKDIAISRK